MQEKLVNDEGILVTVFINSKLYSGIVYRSPLEVTIERTKIAEFFSDDENNSEVMISDIEGSFLMSNIDTSKFPINIKLQEKINIFNKVTAEQVLYEYGKKLGKEYFKQIIEYLNKPCSSTDRIDLL